MQKPVSLLPVCRKFFEKLIFKEMFDFFYWERGNVIKAICLELGDSCMNQIVSLVHEIHKSLHNVIKVRSVLRYLKSFWRSVAWRYIIQIKTELYIWRTFECFTRFFKG